ncbi:TRAP transporter substrate-binding protein DctP [Amphritea sp.]|uniref:TRAP transporter substrate-binding protein DctP n=1 Tax=Amphritea sp. TaxID=1872502 RepID=UPI003A8D1ED4
MNKIKSISKSIISSLTIAAACLGGIEASAATRLTMAGQFNEDHIATKAQRVFAERVEAETDGRVQIRVFAANQLGDYTQVYDELRIGTIDMALISVPSQYDKRLELGYLHYIAKDYEGIRKNYSPGSFVYNKMNQLHNEQGVKFMGFHVDGFGGIGLTKLPAKIKDVSSPKNDVLVRVPPMDIFKLTADDQGFRTVSIPWADLYTAMQTGVADGWVGGTSSLNYQQFRDVIKYYVVNNNFIEHTAWLMSQKSLSKVSPEDAATIERLANELAAQSIDESKENDEKGLQQLEAAGIQVIRLNDTELQDWANNARVKTWSKLSTVLSADLIEELTQEFVK